MWTTDHANALSAVFDSLRQKNFDWMVLRNYEGLPNLNRSKDVDLLFREIEFPCAAGLITQVMASNDFQLIRHDRYQYAWCLTFCKTAQAASISLKIDLLDGFVWRGAQVVNFDDLYDRKAIYLDFYVPNVAYDGFMLWIKPLLTGGFVKEKYKADIRKAVAEHPNEFRRLLIETFGPRAMEPVFALLVAGDVDATVLYQRRLRIAAWYQSFIKCPTGTLTRVGKHVYLELVRRLRRPRISMLAVVGPDGAGKSTFIELLHHRLCDVMVKDAPDVRILHFRPNLIPNIRRLFGGKNYDATKEEFTSPHRAPPAGGLSSFFRLAYYWFDYFVGYWLQIRRRCVAGSIFIFDRYCYDFIVDPRRSRIGLPAWIAGVFVGLTPRPDTVFFLNCDADTIYKRKQELPLNEIERQLQAFRALAQNSKNFITLDATKSPDELCEDAIKLCIAQNLLKH
jgi:thymidylate kinase